MQKAAGLIMAEIREMESIRDVYPTADDINDDGMKFVPHLLALFLKHLIRSPLKQAGLGQGLVQACRPHGSLTPLLFGIGVDADQCGVQQLQTKLFRLGFSLSTDEIRRYKHSIMQVVPNSAEAAEVSAPMVDTGELESQLPSSAQFCEPVINSDGVKTFFSRPSRDRDRGVPRPSRDRDIRVPRPSRDRDIY